MMLRLEILKLRRQRRLIFSFILLLAVMIGALEVSLYRQQQQLQSTTEQMTATLVLLKKTGNPADVQVQKTVTLFETQRNDLQTLNVTKLTSAGYDSMHQQNPWLLYSGQTLLPNLHAGETQATLDELHYLKTFNIPSMMPLTIRINPSTVTTNNLNANDSSWLPALSSRFYEKGWYQVWMWAAVGGVFILLSLLNVFLGDQLATEYDSDPTHQSWLKMQGIGYKKMILVKLGTHIMASLAVVGSALGVFLIYAYFRTGLGNLGYPVQYWQSGAAHTFYLWPTAQKDASFFAPLKMVFQPLTKYLLSLGIFTVTMIVFNSAFTLLINQLVKLRFPVIIGLTLLPLIGFVLPASRFNPYTWLNADWLITNYLGAFQNGHSSYFMAVIVSLLVSAGVIIALTLSLPKIGGRHAKSSI